MRAALRTAVLGGVPPSSLLVYPGRPNLVSPRGAPNGSGWSGGLASVTTSGIQGPDGKSTAGILTADGTSGVHFWTTPGNIATTSGLTYTGAICVKPFTQTSIQLCFGGTAGLNGATIYIDYSLVGAGSITQSGGGVTTGGIRALHYGWYLIWITAASAGNSTDTNVAIIWAGMTDVRAVNNSNATTLGLWGGEMVLLS